MHKYKNVSGTAKRLASILAVGILGCVPLAQAAVVTFDYTLTFSGTAPTTSAPWLTATFDDHNATGSVSLTITANGLGSQSITSIYFNLDPALSASSLVFSLDAGSSTAPAPAVFQGTNAYRADGDGYYDIKLDFPPPGGMQRFDNNDTAFFTITGVNLTANSFQFLSQPGPGNNPGPYYSAAHIQGIPTGYGTTSGWVAPVPVPAALWMFAPALLGMVGLMRRRGHANR